MTDKRVTAAVLVIGDEILSGRTRDSNSGYIAHYDLPKVRNLERLFPQQYRAAPVLVATAAPAMGH